MPYLKIEQIVLLLLSILYSYLFIWHCFLSLLALVITSIIDINRRGKGVSSCNMQHSSQDSVQMTVSMCCISPGSSRLGKPTFAWSCGLRLETGLIFGTMSKVCLKLFLGLEDSSLCLIHRIDLVLEAFPLESADWVFLLYPTVHFHNKGLRDLLPSARLSWICPKR